MVKDDEHQRDGQTPGRHVGALVRMWRIRSGVTVRALAKRSEFSASFISQVENGQASPSIASLEKVLAALGVTLSEFFASDEGRGPTLPIVRGDARPQIASGWSQAVLQTLRPKDGTYCLDPVMITLAAGGRSGSRPEAHAGEEFAFVSEGDVVFTLENQPHTLRKGDTVIVPSGTPHRWENVSDSPASILLVRWLPST